MKQMKYNNVTESLFLGKLVWTLDDIGGIIQSRNDVDHPWNATSRKQLEKLCAINKLMNVAKYLNGDWQPDWISEDEVNYCLCIENDEIYINYHSLSNGLDIYFKSQELAWQAVDILGKETIKLALCTDY